MKGFISYAHRDQEYFNLLVEGIQTYSRSIPSIQIDYWTDQAIEIGDDWREKIGDALEESQFAILLLSPDFVNSDFIRNEELATFLHRSQTANYLIFPVLVRDMDKRSLKEFKRFQFFKALGRDYDLPREASKLIPYSRLVKYNPHTGNPLPNSERDKYHRNLVDAIATRISNYNDRQYSPLRAQKIQQRTGMSVRRASFIPREEIEALGINNPIIKNIHRLNCDRKNLMAEFLPHFEANKHRDCLFYSVFGKNLHCPNSFAERLVYELEESSRYINTQFYYRTLSDGGIAHIQIDLDDFEQSKRQFRVGLFSWIAPESEILHNFNDLNELINCGAPALQSNYIVVLLRVSVYSYPKFTLLKYLEWIREEFCQPLEEGPRFIFIFYYSYWHKRSEKEVVPFLDDLIRFSPQGRQDTLLLRGFKEIRKLDLFDWLRSKVSNEYLAEDFIEKCVQHIDEHFYGENKQDYFNDEDETFQMLYVQSLLNEISEVFNK